MDKYFKKYFDPEDFRKQGHQLVDQLADYLQSCFTDEVLPVLPWRDPAEQYEFWKADFGKPAEESPENFYKTVLDNSIHLHHPRCVGHQVVPPLPQTALTELLEALTNNSMAVYEVGPASSAIERVLTEWLIDKIGWDDKANGLLTSGGSIGNLTALLAARQAYAGKDIWKEGLDEKLAVMVSSESHYSVERAARIMGLGDDAIIRLPVDEAFRIKTDALQERLKESKDKGKHVFALVGNACSTASGKYDPLDDLGDFCRKNNIWFHVDAAHGGPAILSGKYKHLLNGIEMSDSLVLDFHKMMLTPALTTAVLFRDGKSSYRSFSQKADYLLSKEEQWHDIAKRSLECTKKPMALKVYLMLKTYGTELFEKYVEQTYDLAHSFAGIISKDDQMELAVAPDSNIVCFRLWKDGAGDDALNRLNATIREKMLHEGKFYIVQTMLGKKLYLRISIMNPFTGQETLKALLAEVKKQGGFLKTGTKPPGLKNSLLP